ncbi:hypothetical protein AMS68_001117 [Peltaster fructicola]|uniref:ATP-dependent DNA helicase II subunit 2 n=1 Tax=Peltaster fructicola TaxID=286661 RepID=A0A6H0XM76_9PEZI|nr:hypothetical protein AMS68_001117 [Peltaster fructicola]
MAAKEATIYIVDVGATMQERGANRTESNFNWAMNYVWDKLTTTIATGRKTLLSGVIALRSEQTKNELCDDGEHYQHIAVLHELQMLQMPAFRDLQADLVAGSEQDGDIVDSLIIAIHMITKTCKKLAYIKRIILVTDARAIMATDDLGEVARKLSDEQIELIVLGVDFNDPDYGYKEEDKDPTKHANEEILHQLCKDTNGAFGTLAQAIDELSIPRVKQTKPIPSYKGYLSLGLDELKIMVERYPKTMIAKAQSASSFVIKPQSLGVMDDDGQSNDLSALRRARAYQIDDANAPDGKREVDMEDLAKGYEYGRTAVHISESDQNITTFETPQGLDIIGFVAASKYERFMDMGRTNMILPEKSNDKASMALSSFIHALFELESYAVARFVAKENKQPLMVLLSPHIEADFECLYENELPFAEDLRAYRFPLLDRIMTVSGDVITKHRLLPSDDLQAAMDDYVDKMDLISGDDDEPDEYMRIEDTFSPVLHHLNQAIRHRAIYPDGEPPEPAPILTQYMYPPEKLTKAAKPALDKVISTADVKKCPPKRLQRPGKKNPNPLSGLDIDQLLSTDHKRQERRIDPHNALPEFKQAVRAAEDMNHVHGYAGQLEKIIVDWTTNSVGKSNYGRIIEATSVMRHELLELEEPSWYNDFLRRYKHQLLERKLGGYRGDLWFEMMRADNTSGLITKQECGISEVSEEDARAFRRKTTAGTEEQTSTAS